MPSLIPFGRSEPWTRQFTLNDIIYITLYVHKLHVNKHCFFSNAGGNNLENIMSWLFLSKVCQNVFVISQHLSHSKWNLMVAFCFLCNQQFFCITFYTYIHSTFLQHLHVHQSFHSAIISIHIGTMADIDIQYIQQY